MKEHFLLNNKSHETETVRLSGIVKVYSLTMNIMNKLSDYGNVFNKKQFTDGNLYKIVYIS